MDLITAVVSFVVAIAILVVVHEMGHFSVARWAGVKVLRFSIGFGKPLFQRTARNGTEWTIGWLPLGGYVKMLDEREFARDADDPSASSTQASIDPRDLPHAFNRQSVGKRFAIVAAGPVANFLLAILLFSIVYMHGSSEPEAIIGAPPANSAAALAGFKSGEQITGIRVPGAEDMVRVRSWQELSWRLKDAAQGQSALTLLTRREGGVYEHEIRLGAPSPAVAGGVEADAQAAADLPTRLGLMPGGGAPLVAAVEADSPAQHAGLREGDKVDSVDAQPVDDAGALVDRMRASAGKSVRLGVERAGQHVMIDVTPTSVKDPQTGAVIGRIGAALGTRLPMTTVAYGPLDAVRLGAQRTWDIATYSLKMFGRMLTGKASLKNLSGPVTIADYAGKSARLGLEAFISFLALVSISLGVLNLLPIPVLDGGHLLYYAVEAITGRALSDQWQSIMQRVGLLCIVALSVVALFNDLARLVHS